MLADSVQSLEKLTGQLWHKMQCMNQGSSRQPGPYSRLRGSIDRGSKAGRSHAAVNWRQQSVWSDRRRCADRGLGCVFIKARSSEPQAEGSRS